MKLGILGGTFDPIHLGHLRSAVEIGEVLDLEKVYLIPSAQPPHKIESPVTPFHHRLAMTHLGTDGSKDIETLDLEGKRRGLSYSIETLKELHRMFGPTLDLYFIMGMDAFLEIATWRDYRHLLDHTHFVIMNRPGSKNDGLQPVLEDLGIHRPMDDPLRITPNTLTTASGNTITFITPTRMEISSTCIRNLVKQNKTIQFLVPETVKRYIMEKGLYQIDECH